MPDSIHVHNECKMSEEWWKVKTFLKQFSEHMKAGEGYRKAIVGVILTIILQVGGFIYMWSRLATTVEFHGKTLEQQCRTNEQLTQKLDKIIYRMGGVRGNGD